MASKKYPLHGAYLKVARASKHLDTLEAAIDEWVAKSDGYTTTTEYEADGWQLLRCKIVEDFPLDFGILVGEIAHNARSALDHLAWELVKLNPRSKPGRHTGFPIFKSSTKWKAKVEDPYLRPNKFRFKSPLKGVSREAYDDIEKLQPYHRRSSFSAERERLWELAWLNNSDKHRALHVAYGVISDEGITFEVDRPELVAGYEQEVLVEPGQFLEDGLELIRVRITLTADSDYEPNGNLVLPIGLVLAQEDWFVGYPSLREGVNEVIDIIGSFDLAYFEGIGRPTP